MATTAPLDLVLFEDAVAHLCRVARIMRQPMANALLLGMGGSGTLTYYWLTGAEALSD